jgi:hypothetical protein
MSRTEYKVVENSPVEITLLPTWLDVKKVGNKFTLQCNAKNPFSDRYTQIRMVNKSNQSQYIDFKVRQANGN